MAVSTILKLPETLKEQVAQLADEAGKSPHAWIVEAIDALAKQASTRRLFYAEARQSLAEYQRTGVYYPAREVHRYFLARASGREVRRPKPAKRIRRSAAPERTISANWFPRRFIFSCKPLRLMTSRSAVDAICKSFALSACTMNLRSHFTGPATAPSTVWVLNSRTWLRRNFDSWRHSRSSSDVRRRHALRNRRVYTVPPVALLKS